MVTQEIPVQRYDGTALINVRLLEKSGELLLAEKPGQPMGLDDLARVLRLVELHALSNQVLFDRTAKNSTVEHAQEIRGRMADHLGKGVLRIHRSSEKDAVEILDRGIEAMRSSRLLIQEFSFDRDIDRQVSEEAATVFRRWLERACKEPEERLAEVAQEAVEVNFRGGKCFAAIAASGPTLVGQAMELFRRPDHDDRLLVSALINRFRLNYLNQLAIDDCAAYCPDLPFENLTREHMKLFVDYLVREMVGDLEQPQPDRHLLVRNLAEDLRLPPVGLLLLMSCREKGEPLELFRRGEQKLGATQELKKHLWGVSAKSLTHGEVDEEVQDIFAREYEKLEYESVPSEPPGLVRRYLLPTLSSAIGGAGTSLGDDLVGLVTALFASGSTALVSNLLQRKGTPSYLTQYNRLKHEIAKGRHLRKRGVTALSDQVERVFNRPLALA
ncbi:MAG: hypothetical protein AAF604_07075 [Acidobacteriota bacterium]